MERILFLIMASLLSGCAQIVAPTGGPKDETPPKVIKESPANLSTGMASNTVVITFDEYVALNNPAQEILISPPMRQMPTYSLKKKSLVLKFQEDLAANTTYTVNFGQAIKDNNEGNILKNYTYVFGTGSVLDSMYVTGRLSDAITGQPVAEALVMLYKSDNDSLPLDSLPNYFTRSTSDGNFRIDKVADRPYRIFALNDQNSNYLFDIPDEQVGFLDTMIVPSRPAFILPADTISQDSTLQDSIRQDSILPVPKANTSYEMSMFVEQDTTQFLKRAFCQHYGKLVFAYNRPVRRFRAEIAGVTFKKQWALKEFSSARDTVVLWTTDAVPDTLVIHAKADRLAVDTVELVMKPRPENTDKGKKGKRIGSDRFELTLRTDPADGKSPRPGRPLTIIGSHPILNVDIERISMKENGTPVQYKFTSSDTALRRFDLFFPWKKGADYTLSVKDSAFSDLFGLWSDTLQATFIGTDDGMFGELTLNLTAQPQMPLIIQLQSSDGKVIRSYSINDKKPVVFDRLEPGKYSLQAVYDANGNGKWDSGRYLEHLQPEVTRSIKSGSDVKASWNTELDWDPSGPAHEP